MSFGIFDWSNVRGGASGSGSGSGGSSTMNSGAEGSDSYPWYDVRSGAEGDNDPWAGITSGAGGYTSEQQAQYNQAIDFLLQGLNPFDVFGVNPVVKAAVEDVEKQGGAAGQVALKALAASGNILAKIALALGVGYGVATAIAVAAGGVGLYVFLKK